MIFISTKCFPIKSNIPVTFVVLLSIIFNIKCILSYQRRGVFRMIRKSPLWFTPPKAAPAQFSMTYDVPSFLPSPPLPSNSYGAPAMNYELPAISNSPPPSFSYNAPPQSYGPPSTTAKPIIHKHIYVHVPPPEPDIQVTK